MRLQAQLNGGDIRAVIERLHGCPPLRAQFSTPLFRLGSGPGRLGDLIGQFGEAGRRRYPFHAVKLVVEPFDTGIEVAQFGVEGSDCFPVGLEPGVGRVEFLDATLERCTPLVGEL